MAFIGPKLPPVGLGAPVPKAIGADGKAPQVPAVKPGAIIGAKAAAKPGQAPGPQGIIWII